MLPLSSTPITRGWSFKQGGLTSSHEYLPSHDVPTEIYRDLLKHENIPDPFLDINEPAVRWVGNETWTYKVAFDAGPDYGKSGTTTTLKFDGLDTFASVYLNGQLILQTENMFVAHEVNVTNKLSSQNVLEIVFQSARNKGRDLVTQHQEHRFIVHQTEISRGPVRKAQYQWGWDWGPILLSCGPWKPISLVTYTCRLPELVVKYELQADLKSALVTVTAMCEGPIAAVVFAVSNNSTKEVLATSATLGGPSNGAVIAEASFKMENIELWWPRGHGPQALYTIEATAYAEKGTADQVPMHSLSQSFGLREVELVQEPDEHGTSFYLRINHVDIFCGGSCWIPADSFLTRLTPEKYRSWVKLAADGNQVMLRVWGGGIYEANAFYDAADELGILVWQDFAFACANYPAYPEYLASVEQEARQNVRRLRHHPSLVIWAGNNEDYQIVERYGLHYDVSETNPQEWLKTDFPARYIYEYLLPQIVDEESPRTPYHPSSPFGNGSTTVLKVDPTIGDIHQWNVWHGTMEPYQRLPELGGRFVSEFGMEAYPHVSTLEKCITRESERFPGSMSMDARNKAIGHERRLVSYVAENFRLREGFEAYAHLTQVMQADAMAWAYKSWRRHWGTAGSRQCGGALVWQLNDCWPTISWAIVDYNLVPKPAYYAVKRALQPLAIGVQRKFKSWTMRPADDLWQRDTGHVDFSERGQVEEFDVWVANSSSEELKGLVLVKFFCIETGEEISQELRRNVFEKHVIEAATSEAKNGIGSCSPFIIRASLYVNDQLTASDLAWPDPIKYLSFEDRDVQLRYSDDKTLATITCAKPVKGFVFSEKEGVRLSDNGFDLIPGETKEVSVEGCAANELKWRYIEMQEI
ncbi:glycoside hydrolase [Pyrenochaeta sp. DS3sAY3a]|nr:glycoside hydrolase [Pyrenochaeta sp. DS3sAY3a]